MSIGTPYQYDTGTSIRLTVKDRETGAIVNLSSLDSATYILLKPDLSVLTVVAGLYSDGTDGTLEYVTDGTEFDQVGRWKVQANIVLPGGQWTTSPETFTVKDKFGV